MSNHILDTFLLYTKSQIVDDTQLSPPHKVKLLRRLRSDFTLIPLDNYKKKAVSPTAFFFLLKRFLVMIVLQIEGGEKVEDFTKIYEEYFQNVYKYVYSLCHNESLAEEITQETFFKVFRNIDKFKGDCHLFTWICQIAKNTYFTFYNKQKKMNSEDVIPKDTVSDESLENLVLDKEQARRLHILLHKLPEPYKEVFSLRVFGELPFSQIGELFNKKDSWARLIFYRAKTELRRRLDEDNM